MRLEGGGGGRVREEAALHVGVRPLQVPGRAPRRVELVVPVLRSGSWLESDWDRCSVNPRAQGSAHTLFLSDAHMMPVMACMLQHCCAAAAACTRQSHNTALEYSMGYGGGASAADGFCWVAVGL